LEFWFFFFFFFLILWIIWCLMIYTTLILDVDMNTIVSIETHVTYDDTTNHSLILTEK
jgi:hypothetical protein